MLLAPALPTEAPVSSQPPPLDYYRVDTQRLTFAEGWRLAPSWKVVLLWLGKLMGNSIGSSGGIPVPSALRDNLISLGEIPPRVAEKLIEVQSACEAIGFHTPLYYANKHTLAQIEAAACVLQEPAGETIANLAYARSQSFETKTPAVLGFITLLRDGRLLLTNNVRRRFNSPPGDDLKRMVGAAASPLYKEHRRRIERHRAAGNPPVPIRTFEELASLMWRNDRRTYEFNLARGVYVPLTYAEVEEGFAQKARGQRAAAVVGSPGSAEEANAVLSTLALRDRPNTSSAFAQLVMLGVSIVVFAAFGGLRWSWDYVALIVGTLLIHETGHYLAMRAFGYRNLQMFFIPFFGAAVSGLSRRAAGWQKAVVLLAGPLPGILLGAGLFLAAPHLGSSLFAWKAAIVLLSINTFNLLPLLPLDGGRFLSETLFSRHPLLRTGFSVLAGLGMLAAGYFLGFQVGVFLGLLVLVAVPSRMRIDRVAGQMRSAGMALMEPAAVSGGEEQVRPEALPPILEALKYGRATVPARKGLVTEAIAVIDQMRARPPGWGVTLGLVAIYVAACAVAAGLLLPLAARPRMRSEKARAEFRRRIEAARAEHARAAAAEKGEDQVAQEDSSEDVKADSGESTK